MNRFAMREAFAFTIRIYYEDTDAAGIVYYANYLKFLERARTEWLRALGFEQDGLARRERVIFVVRSMNIEFLQPARFNDLIEVRTAVVARRGATLTFAQTIRRAPADAAAPAVVSPRGHGAAGAAVRSGHGAREAAPALCQAEVRVACLDAATRAPRALPAMLVARLKEVHP